MGSEDREELKLTGRDAEERCVGGGGGGDTGWKPVLQGFDPAAEFEIRCRNLPHWRQEGATYFVTFRLGDSLPQEKLRRLREERLEWVRRHPPPVSEADLCRFQALFSAKVEQHLHAGYGACWLKHPSVADVAEQALLHFNDRRYALGWYVIMPNHVHVLVRPRPGEDLSRILHSWKSFTANAINRLLHRTGRVWQEESFDHIVRGDEELRHYERYILENPRNAGLSEKECRIGSGTTLCQASTKKDRTHGNKPQARSHRQDACATDGYRQDACATGGHVALGSPAG
ncbi:MAG: transposase [Planctomycetes bacterium]|nr:transposase [Planctomycetota bacterium]